MPITQRIKKSPGRFRIDCRPNKYFSFQLANVDFGQEYITVEPPTFFRNQTSSAVVKLLYLKPLYSGHLSIADTLSENQWCPLLRGFTVFVLYLTLTQSNQNIGMKMGVAEIRLVHSIAVNIVDESLI